MGVKLADLFPKAEINYDLLKGKKIAVDASNVLYQFVSSIRQRDGTPLMDSKSRITSHLVGIFTRFSNLISKGIKLAVVFDGKPPLLKIREQERRAFLKETAMEKFEEAKQEEDIASMYKYSKQATKLSREMFDESKELIKAMGMPVIQSPSESDAQMAFMNEQDDVWACSSSDYDCLLHGAPRLIPNLTLSQVRKLPNGKVVKTQLELIDLKKGLRDLKITHDQLIALGILVGTDYNIGGVKGIGPKKALKLVLEHKNFDDLFASVKADFNWKEIYAVFKSMPIMKNYQLRWQEPDVEKIKKILIDEHDFSEERVQSTIEKLNEVKKSREQKGLGDFF
ncbi:MAG TPA: flap endonuclease-1 [Candidatus Nanoarchaeia archaeon]|nr:flap endonuclease-1 [Candidatus Nanoarchaeia archaeon]